MAKIPKKPVTPKPSGKTLNPGSVERGSQLNFNFEYDFLKAIKTNGFNNYLKDEAEFSKNIFNIVMKIIPVTQKEWNSAHAKGHTHKLTDPKHDKKAKEIIKKLHGEEVDLDVLELWQLAPTSSQGLRLICNYARSANTMHPLFVDYHHMIASNPNYSKKAINQHSKFCPHEKYS